MALSLFAIDTERCDSLSMGSLLWLVWAKSKRFCPSFRNDGVFFFATCSLRFDSIAISILFLSWREWTRESRAKSMASNRRTKGVYIFFFLKKILQKKSLLTSSSVDLVDILHARSEANKDLPSPINRLAHPHLGPRKRERERENKINKIACPKWAKDIDKDLDLYLVLPSFFFVSHTSTIKSGASNESLKTLKNHPIKVVYRVLPSFTRVSFCL